MKFTPLDVRHQEFPTRLGSYDRTSVRAFLNELSDDMETLLQQHQALRDQLTGLERQLEEQRQNEDEIRRAVVAAERISHELRENAVREAELMIAQATLQRDATLRDAESRRAELESGHQARLAALEATLRLYRNPDRLPATLPTLRFLTRPVDELRALADRLLPAVAEAVGAGWAMSSVDCTSQIGSGALPLETIPSHGLAIEPVGRGASGSAVEALAASFRRLPVPVIGRIEKGALRFDLRCLEDVDGFTGQLGRLVLPAEAGAP